MVSLDDFDDSDILDAADRIRRGETGGFNPLDDGPPSKRERLIVLVSDLATAIVGNDPIETLRRLDDLVGDDKGLREAVDLGRRRRS